MWPVECVTPLAAAMLACGAGLNAGIFLILFKVLVHFAVYRYLAHVYMLDLLWSLQNKLEGILLTSKMDLHTHILD